MGFFFLKKAGIDLRCLTGALVLVFVFFLPFHFHFSTAAQISKECSCYQGGRTQAGLAPAQADYTPALQASPIVVYEHQVFGWLSIYSHAARAPPSL